MEEIAAPWPGAVAVSGGGDSLGLMHLLAAWAKQRRAAPPVVLTVDHGLHDRSRANARLVAQWARRAGLKSSVLRWTGVKPLSDIEARARDIRYALIGQWCAARGVGAVYVAHTRDDQAETFLLRLARGSGLDGLAAMSPLAPYPVARFADLRVVRPLIGFERDALRGHLTALGQEWLEDPMNQDPRFARVRIRAAMTALAAAGLTASRVADAAAHLGRARQALDVVTAAVLERACRVEDGAVLLETAVLAAAPREVALRGLAQLLMAVSGQSYRPRFDRLERLFDAMSANGLGGGRTLHGCRIGPAQAGRPAIGTVRIAREGARRSGKARPSPAPPPGPKPRETRF